MAGKMQQFVVVTHERTKWYLPLSVILTLFLIIATIEEMANTHPDFLRVLGVAFSIFASIWLLKEANVREIVVKKWPIVTEKVK
jgi:hypothetical protein